MSHHGFLIYEFSHCSFSVEDFLFLSLGDVQRLWHDVGQTLELFYTLSLFPVVPLAEVSPVSEVPAAF